jgi:hypothetical protein
LWTRWRKDSFGISIVLCIEIMTALNNQLKLATGYIYIPAAHLLCVRIGSSLCVKAEKIFPRMKDDVIIKTSVRTR